MANDLQIGPLHGGGLVLGYRCSSRCRHCLYGAGPHRRDGEPPSDQALEALLDRLAECGPRARYHIGGGEPFLDVDRLERAVAGMVGRGLALDYVETNAAWVRDRSQAVRTLERLASVGLGCVLVSLSPFHAEHIALRKTLELIAAAEQVLSGGAFVWIEPFMADLSSQPRERPIDLDELLADRGDAYARDLCSRYHLVAAGRAGRFLAHHGQRLPWRSLTQRAPCRQRLCDTSHFHVDGEGLRSDDLVLLRLSPAAQAGRDPVRSVVMMVDTSASRALGFEHQLSLIEGLVAKLAEGTPIVVAAFDQGIDVIYEGPASGYGGLGTTALRQRQAFGASDLGEAIAWAGSKAKATSAKRVILVTDGVPTVGVTEAPRLQQASKARGRERWRGLARFPRSCRTAW